MNPDRETDDTYMDEEASYHEECGESTDGLDGYDDATLLKVGKSMVDDIDDRINSEFMSGEPTVEITAQSSKRFRVIPEE